MNDTLTETRSAAMEAFLKMLDCISDEKSVAERHRRESEARKIAGIATEKLAGFGARMRDLFGEKIAEGMVQNARCPQGTVVRFDIPIGVGAPLAGEWDSGCPNCLMVGGLSFKDHAVFLEEIAQTRRGLIEKACLQMQAQKAPEAPECEAIEQARRKLWHWPQGRMLSLNALKFVRAVCSDGDGQTCFDEGCVWTRDQVSFPLTRAVEVLGRQPASLYRFLPSPGALPRIEMHVFRAVDELPPVLCEWEHIDIDGRAVNVGHVPVEQIREMLKD